MKLGGYSKKLFSFEIVGKKDVDTTHKINTIVIEIGWDHHIGLDNWNNFEFLKFVDKIRFGLRAEFSFKTTDSEMENFVPDWIFDDNILSLTLWKEVIVDVKTIPFRKEYVSRLDDIYNAVERYNKTGISDCKFYFS